MNLVCLLKSKGKILIHFKTRSFLIHLESGISSIQVGCEADADKLFRGLELGIHLEHYSGYVVM